MKQLRFGVFGVFCLIVGLPSLNAQSAHKLRRDGDLMYDQREYRAAEERYRKANSDDPSAETSYNLGSAIYNQERYDEAVKQYETAAQKATDPNLKADAYFNLGNTYMSAQKLDKSIESYIESLKIRPDDSDTKKNLTMALQQMKQQQQQQQQQGDDNKEQEQQDQDQQQQQQQNQDRQDQQQQQQQQQQEQDQQDQESQAQEGSEKELSKEEAEELMKIINNEDERVQEKLRKGDPHAKKPKKDW